jgi:hypothetical protein
MLLINTPPKNPSMYMERDPYGGPLFFLAVMGSIMTAILFAVKGKIKQNAAKQCPDQS